jgi:hypothetical protein
VPRSSTNTTSSSQRNITAIPPGSEVGAYDVVLLGDPDWPFHLCVEVVPGFVSLGADDGWLSGGVRLQIPLQQRQQPPRRRLPTPGGQCVGGKDVPEEFLGRGGGAVCGADV